MYTRVGCGSTKYRTFSFPVTVIRGLNDELLFNWWGIGGFVDFDYVPGFLREKVELLLMAFCGKMFSTTNGFDEIADVGRVTYNKRQACLTIYLEVEEPKNGNNA